MIMMPKLLLCPPDYFDVVDQKNPYMTQNDAVERAKARSQWDHLCAVLQQSGCEIETINPVEGLEDMVFAANQAFVGEKTGYGKFAVPSHMLHESRQREVPHFVEWYCQHDYKIIALDFGGDYLEGHGDLLWHPDEHRVYAGYGFRSTLGGVQKFAAAMSQISVEVVPLELVDPYCYHLDTCLCPLNHEAVLIFPGAYLGAGIAQIHKFWQRVHLLTADEAHQFMGNGIVVNGRYITPHLTPPLEAILLKEGLTPVVVETSEFEKAGGSCSCMKTLLAGRGAV
jgi:N-dimethylarginine dimethylaminohydrolase